MFKKNDPNSFTAYHSLYDGKSNLIGYLIAEYRVTSYDKVQTQNKSSLQRPADRSYLLHCTQRVVITNSLNISPSKEVTSYNNYPVMINTHLKVNNSAGNQGLNIQVLDYSPQTLNTKVQKAGSVGNSQGQTLETDKSSTVGSSTSESNSYGATVSVGLTELSDSASASYDHSSSFSQDHSSSSGSSTSYSNGRDASNSASMSVKDWGAYGSIDPAYQSPNWIFAQEYPWDVIECTKTNGTVNPNNKNQVPLNVPTDVLSRLYDGVCLYPPSQLSLFGINFVMKTVWLISLDNTAPDEVSIEHKIFYSTGSHVLPDPNNKATVYLDDSPAELLCGSGAIVTPLDLPLMGLAPLGLPNKPAITGFLPKNFVVDPSNNPFKIISLTNTLLIEDSTSYTAYPASPYFFVSETALTARLTTPLPGPLSITAYFKIVDTVNDYKLYLKHWKTGTTGIRLTITINEDPDSAIIKYVDALEATGGENNLLSVSLRDQNFSSVDFHDYLQLGLNSIQLSIEPIDNKYGADCGYQLRALSIENI